MISVKVWKFFLFAIPAKTMEKKVFGNVLDRKQERSYSCRLSRLLGD